MRIVSINFNFNNKIQKLSPKNTSPSFKSTQKDTFERRKSNVQDELIVAANKEKIKGNNEEKIIDLLKLALNTEKIGKGSEGKVYKIPNSGLVIKLFIKKKNDKPQKPTFDLTKTQENKDILAIGNNYEILRFNQGIVQKNNFSKKQKEAYDFLVFNLPQKTYDDFIKTIGKKHSKGIFFDTIGHNVLVDIKNKKFHAIDLSDEFYCATYYFELDNKNYKINPIDCFGKSLDVNPNNPDGNKFIAKTFKAVARDCKYFPIFTFETRAIDDFKDIANYRTYQNLYARLKVLHNKKMNLRYKSENEIEKILSKDIEKFIKSVDNKIPQTSDLDDKYLEYLKDIITKNQ